MKTKIKNFIPTWGHGGGGCDGSPGGGGGSANWIMKEITPKWRLEKVEMLKDGKLDEEFSGYNLQKDGITLCKFKVESLRELKVFFEKLEV